MTNLIPSEEVIIENTAIEIVEKYILANKRESAGTTKQ